MLDQQRDDVAVYRDPPFNNEAEQALLGALLCDNRSFDRISEIVKPEHFMLAVHGRIFGAVKTVIERGQVANPVSLKNYFDKDGALIEIGGAAYLARLAASVVTTVNAVHYARTIADLSMRRQIMQLLYDGLADAGVHDLERPAPVILETIEAGLAKIGDLETTGDGLLPMEARLDATLQRVNDAWQNRGSLMGTTTGLLDLDKHTGGLMPGELIVIAGRPAMGKTTLAMTIALASARASTAVAYFSLEMSAEQLTQWALAETTGVSADRQRRGSIDEYEIEALAAASGQIRPLPFHIDDTPGLSVAQVRTRARRMKRKLGLGLIVVDHLGLLRASKEAARQGETAAITEITNQLKALAKELHVPVVALSQLNRGVEAREDKRPGMADLRQSGSIEQDADIIIMCYRQEYYEGKAKPERKSGEHEDKYQQRLNDWHETMDRCRGIAELLGVKHRSGPEFNVRCLFQPSRSRMANLSEGIHE